MAITKNVGRQWPIVAKTTVGYADVTTTVAEAMMDIPGGATVLRVGIDVTTAWDSLTSDTMDIGDGGDPNRYTTTSSAIDVTTLGYTDLSADAGYKYTVLDTVDVIWTGTGTAPTAGSADIIVEYILDDRAHETQPAQ